MADRSGENREEGLTAEDLRRAALRVGLAPGDEDVAEALSAARFLLGAARRVERA